MHYYLGDSMNKKILSLTAGSLFISFLGCDIINPTNSPQELNPNAGNLSDHLHLPNTYVSESTKDSVGSLLKNLFYIPSTGIPNSISRPYTGSNSDTTISIDSTFKVNGEHSGHAEIEKNGSMTTNFSSEDTKINYTASITYYDYSNDGKVFIGGETKCNLNANFTEDQENISIKLDGHVKFNGLFIGECKYNMNVFCSSNQFDYSGDMKIISDGEEYIYNIDEIK